MATKIYFRNVQTSVQGGFQTGTQDAKLDTTLPTGWNNLWLSTTRGAAAGSWGVTSVAGPTNGIEVTSANVPRVWTSDPLDADVTISGSITWNLRAAESAMTANAAVNAQLEVVDGATGTITLIDKTARTIECGTSESANNFAETPASGVACKRGDRLRVRVFFDDSVDGNMASGSTLTFWFNGADAATGDSYFTLTENLTFVSEPAGTTIYPTNTASAVSTASVDREAWTSRGAGVQTDVTNTAAGWTAPIQVTDTAGGTVVDWFTKQLAAVTLGGGCRVNVRSLISNVAANAGPRIEVARVDSDGTNPTVWAAMTSVLKSGTTEVDRSLLIGGDDLAISDGQRLRIRFYIDDADTSTATSPMVTGHTQTLHYAGTTGGASGDTYLKFTQTLTEYVPAGNVTVTPTTAALVITKNIPTVTASNHQSVTPTTKALTSATFAPTVTTAAATYPQLIVSHGPVGYWRMGEPSGSVLDSIGGNHGTATGTTRDVTGALTANDDGAITFNGTSDKVRMGDVLDQTGAVTYELWLKRANTTAALQYLMNKGAGQPNVMLRDDHYVQVGEENVTLVASSTAILNNTAWHHIVFTWTGAAAVDAAKLYVDGVNVGLHLNTATIAGNSSSLSLGAAYVDALWFAGTIDEAAIYNSVLTAAQILAHYNKGISGPQLVTPTTAALVVTKYAPTARTPILATPTTKAVVLTKYAPTVNTPVRATPTTASLTATRFAPTVTATDNQRVTPTTASLTATKYAPTVSTPERVTPTTKALALAAFAPVVTATSAQSAIPATAALLLSAFAPSVTATAHQLVTPTTATVVLIKYAPTVTAGADVALVAGTASVTLTTYAPTVTSAQHVTVTPNAVNLITSPQVPTATASDHQRVTPTTAVLTITENAPAAQTPSRVVPATAPLATVKFAPTVSTPQTFTPTTKSLSTATFAPTITNPQTYVPTKLTLVLASFAPTVDVTAASTIVVPNKSLTITRHIPVVSATAHLVVTPQTVALTTTKFAPTVSATSNQVVIPAVKSLTATTYAPTVSASSAQGIVPGKATLTLTRYAPTVSTTAHIAVIPSTKVLQLNRFAPAVRVANLVRPAATALVLTTLAPIVTPTLNTLVRPNPNALTITEYGPLLEISGHAAFTPPTTALNLTTYPPTAEQHSITPLGDFVYGFAVVAMGDSGRVGTENGGATVRSEGGGTTVSTSGPSARVTVR